jgi:DNA-binding transcriptional LysR family regulator
MHLDLDKLHVFREVARAGSYTVAARHLHVTQSAVSHAIRKLEQSVGAPLIEWRSRTLHLTEQGEVLYRSSERVFAELEETEELLLGDRLPRIAIRLGATVEFGTTVLIRKMGPLLRARPELHVDYMFSHDVAALLLRDEVDVAVDCRPLHHPSITSTPLFREKYVVVASDEFLSRHPIEAPADLSNIAVLSMDKNGEWWGNFLRALPRAERPALEHIVEVNHIRGIINAALDGQGVGFVPTYTVIAELEDDRLRRLFPDVTLLEDRFSILQKRARAGRAKNRLVTEYLLGLDASEFGDAIQAVGA